MRFIIYFLFPYCLFATVLHDAVVKMDKEAVRENLSQTDINALKDGKTALCLAVESEQSSLVKLLLEASADQYIGTPSPIDSAFASDNAEIVALLMDYNTKLPQDLGVSSRGLIYDLLLQRRYKTVELLLNRGVKFEKMGSLNAFSLALSYAPSSLVAAFLKQGIDLNYKDPYLDRPLDIALRMERLDVLDLLLKHGADAEDSSFLEIALTHSDLGALKLLVRSGCRVDDKNKELLILAVKLGSLDILKEIVEAGADINFSNKNHETVLTEAVKYHKREILSWLLALDIDEKAHDRALFHAIANGDMEMVSVLAEKDIGLKAKEDSGLSPLLYAMKLKQFEIAKLLLGFDIDIESKDDLGESALFKSIRFFQDEIFDSITMKSSAIDEKSDSGLSPVNLSVSMTNFKAFKKLLSMNAELDNDTLFLSVKKGLERFYIQIQDKFKIHSIVDDEKNTLLHTAAAYDRNDILKRLLLNGLNREAVNERGETALHVAAKQGFKQSCVLLLSFKANDTVQDARENQAKHLAFKNNHVKLGKWLENYQAKIEEELQKDDNASNVSEF